MEKNVLQTVDRALIILEILSEEGEGLTATQIEKRLGLNKSTVHRLMMTLLNRGFVEKEERTNAYKIGLRMVELSSLRLNNLELKTESTPILRELAFKLNQPSQLAIYSEGDAVFLDKIQPVHSIRMYSQIGKRIPVYCSSVGKALVLQWDDHRIMRMLMNHDFNKFTGTTLETPESVLEEIKEARKTGYAIDNEEHEEGIFCLAAPIYDYRGKIIAAVSTAGTNDEFIGNKKSMMIEEVKEAARKISRRMGYRKG